MNFPKKKVQTDILTLNEIDSDKESHSENGIKNLKEYLFDMEIKTISKKEPMKEELKVDKKVIPHIKF